MAKTPMVALLALVTAACASGRSDELAPRRAADFRPEQIHRPVLFVRLAFATRLEDNAREATRSDYEMALLEGLNARAVLARDVRVLAGGDGERDAGAALARARELGADHAIVVSVQLRSGEAVFCRETRRPFRAEATLWSETVQVVRTSDGAPRLAVPASSGLEVNDFDADCENPRASHRRASGEVAVDAVNRLLGHIAGP